MKYSRGAALVQDWRNIAGSGAGTTTHTVRGLANGTAYTFAVRAVSAAGRGSAASVSATPVPAAPGGLTATARDGLVRLEWTDPMDTSVTGYQFRYSPEGMPYSFWTNRGVGTSQTIGGLTNGNEYTFELRATAGAVHGDASLAKATPYPAAPAGLETTAGVNQVRLDWHESGDASVTAYQLIYYSGGRPLQPAWNDIPGNGAGTPDHVVTGLTNGTTYTFEVRAKATATPGDSSVAMDTPVPGAPAGLTGLSRDGSVVLSWDDPGDAAIDRYQVRHAESGAALPGWRERHYVAGSGSATTEHPVTELTNGTDYTFEVRARAGAGPPADATATPYPGAPADLEAAAGVGEVRLNWTDPGDAAVTAYQLLYYSGVRPPQPSWNEIPGSGAGTTDHVVTGLTNGTTYTFELRPTAGAAAGDSSVAKATPYPAAPAGLETTAGVNQVRLDWHESGDASVTAYQLIHYGGVRPPRPAWDEIPGSGAGTTDHAVTGLTNGTTYTFELRPTAGAAAGDSSVATATPVPGTPAGLTGLSRDGSVVLSWDDPGDAAIDRYQVRHAESGAALPGWRERHYVAGSGSATMEHPVTELTNGTDYTFEVRARAGAVHGAAAEVTAMAGCPAITVSGLGDTTVTAGADVSLSVRAAGGCGALTYAMSGAPEDVEIDENTVAVTGPAAPAGAYEVTVTATDAEGNTGEGQFTITVECPAIGVEGLRDTSLTVGAPIENIQARGSGSQASYWYSISSDPAEGITLSIGERDGNITGTTAAAGTYTVTVTVRDDHGCSGRGTFTMTVNCPGIAIADIRSFEVEVNQPFSRTAGVSGGCGTRSSSREDGPEWVRHRIDEGGNLIVHGTAPSTPGTHDVRVRVKDRGDARNHDDEQFTITVVNPPPPPLGIMCASDTTVFVGGSIIRTASAWEGVAPYTFSPLSVTPSGLSLTLSAARGKGTITGTAEREGVYRVTVTVRDHDGASESCGFNVTVRRRPCSTISVSQSPDPVTVKAGGTVTVSADGGCGTKTFGDPGGLGWVTKTGSNQYTVEPPAGTAPETYTFSVTATDTEQNTGAGTIDVRVTCSTITVNAGNNMTMVVKESIRRTATAEGGGSHSFSLSVTPSSGQDLSIGGTNGVITGSVSQAGTYTVTVTATATNAPSCPSGSDEFIVTVDCPDIRVEGLRDLTVTKGASLPSMTATASGGQTPYTFRKKSGPSWVTVSSSGAIGGTATGDPGEYDVTVEATDDCGCKGSGTFRVTVSCPTITVGGVRDVTVTKGASLPSMTATASGGQTPYTFRRKIGPSWVTVSSSGAIGGTATGDLNEYDVTVEGTDDCGCKGTKTFTITVDCPDIIVSGLYSVPVEVGQNIPSMTARASGGQSPYRYTMSGAPSTVRINPTTGVVSGNVGGEPGSYSMTVKATDAGGCWGTATFEFAVFNPPVKIRDIGDVEADVNKAISSITPSVSGGEEPYTFSVSGKPAGISFSTSTGVISGAPTALGTFNITVTVRDIPGETAETDFTMYVSRALSIMSISNVVVTWQLDMDPIQVSASGGRGSYTYDLESEPAGISISSSGSIGGTPTQLGSATVTVIVRDKGGRQEEESFTMTVALPGDFNGDGTRDAADAKLFNRMMGLRRSDSGYDRRMDLNGDGTINYADFVILTGYIESDASSQSGQ